MRRLPRYKWHLIPPTQSSTVTLNVPPGAPSGAGPAALARRQPRHVQCSCCTSRRNCRAPAGPVMQGITLHCKQARVLNSSLSRVCTAGAPRCCQRPREDLQVACCAPRIWRNCHFLLAGDCQGIMPARADHLGTATNVYTERAQCRRGTTQHFYRSILPIWCTVL